MEQNKSVVMHDRFDTTVFNETRTQFPTLDEIAASETIPEADMFVEDTFCTFYKPAPVLEDESTLSLTAQIRRRLTEEMMATAEYQRVRASGTMQDQFSSALATAAVSYRIMDRLDNRTKDRMSNLQKFEQEAEKLFNQAQNLQQMAEHAEGQEAEEIEEEAEQLAQQAQTQQDQAQAVYNQLQSDMERIEDQARRAARTALQNAEDQINEANAAINAYGGYSQEQSTPSQRMSTKQKMELAQKLKDSPKLAKIAELAGKMVNTALNKQKTKVIHPPDEIVGITVGDDLPKVLPSELILLDDELTEMLFYQRYTERALMQYDMIGHEPQSKGPIIACVDESGSMDETHINEKRLARKLKDLSEDAQYEARVQANANAYTKEVWSKAVVMALLAVARHQHRDFCVVYFSYRGELKTYTFPKAKASAAELLDMAEFFFGGGTTFDGWMTESLVIAEKGMFENADIIVISDGDVYIGDKKREEYNTRRTAKKVHAYGVLLATTKKEGDNLRSVTDQMITVTDLEADSKALDMMFNI